MRPWIFASFLVATAAAALLSRPDTALSASSVDNLLIDTDISGNTATSIGPTENCLQTTVGATFSIDVVVGPAGIPPDRPLAGFEFQLSYDPSVIEFVSVDVNQMMASIPGSFLIDLSHTIVPGLEYVAVVDLGTDADEIGPGVLARLTFTAVSTGSMLLIPAELSILDPVSADTGITVPVGDVRPAVIAVRDPAACATLDSDGDGVPDLEDNCINDYNRDQTNTDLDAYGNLCDEDDDNDGVSDREEIFRYSDPLNPASTPERWTFSPASCSDGIDNDLDGKTDSEDLDCPGPVPPQPPPNDNFANSIPIASLPFFDSERTTVATMEPAEQLPCGGTGYSIWYSFTTTSAVSLNFDFSSDAVAVYTGTSLADLSFLACPRPWLDNIPPGTTIYIQVAQDAFFPYYGYLRLDADSDADRVADRRDNCPSIYNPAQPDSDLDGLGEACDPTASHTLQVTATDASALNIRLDKGGVGEFNLAVDVTNLGDHADLVSLEVTVNWLPYTCEVARTKGATPRTIAAHSSTTFVVRVIAGCSPETQPGRYNLAIGIGTVHHATTLPDFNGCCLDVGWADVSLHVR